MPISDQSAPYAGLRPFRIDEDYLFFGREEQTAELVRLLREQRFLAVVGRSGSGKSSLVRAGLLPEVQGGMMQSVGSAWEIAVLRPGGHPVRNLAEALVEADLYDAEDVETVPRLLATLNHSAMGLVEAFRQSDIEPDTNLLILVDQFEELFRFGQHDSRAQDQAHAFVELLLEASSSRDVSVYVVLTMRSDYLGDCAHVPGLAEAVNRGEYLIPRLNRNQLRAAIEGPAKVGGAAISYRLVQHLLNELGDEEDQLPILQHALMRTWSFWEDDHQGGEEVDLRHYEGIGGMQRAISNHADEIFDSLPDNRHRRVVETMFRSLTVKGEDNRGVRRPTPLGTLVRIADEDPAVLRTVADAYRRQGVTFLMPGEGVPLDDDTVIDLSHESLMRVWQRLRRWVDDEAQSARIYQRLVDTAQLWEDGKAGLYHDPDLAIAQTWREDNDPNAAWAEQYGGGFSTAAAFLDKSHEEAAREEEEREASRQRELEQAQALARSQQHSANLLRRFAATVGIAAALAIGLAVWAMRESKIAKEQRTIAEHLTKQAEEAEAEAQAAAASTQRAEGRTWLANAVAMLESKNTFGARLKALRSVGFEGAGREKMSAEMRESLPVLLQDGQPGRGEAEQLVRDNNQVTLLWQNGLQPQHAGFLNDIALSPDRTLLASVSEENVVRVWNAETGDALASLETELGNPEVLGFSPDGELLALAGNDQITFWRVADGEFSPMPEGIIHASAGGAELLAADDEQPTSVTNPDFRQMRFSPDGNTLVLGDEKGHLYVWKDWRSFEGLPATPLHVGLHTGRIVDMAFQPGGNLLATVARTDTVVQLLDATTFEVLPEVDPKTALPPEKPTRDKAQDPVLWSVEFSPDGKYLLVGGQHVPVTVWDSESRELVATLLQEEWGRLTMDTLDGEALRELGFGCGDLAFSEDGSRLAVSWRQFAHNRDPLWYPPTVTLLDTAQGFSSPERLQTVAVSATVAPRVRLIADGQRLFSANQIDDNVYRLELHDLASNNDKGSEAGSHAASVGALCFSRDGTLFASADAHGSVKVWSARSGTLRHSFDAHIARIRGLTFSADGQTLFSAGYDDHLLRAWDLSTGEMAEETDGGHPLVGLELSPTGESLVAGGWSKDYQIYDPATLESQQLVDGRHGNSLVCSPDGDFAVTYRRENYNFDSPLVTIHRRLADLSLEAVQSLSFSSAVLSLDFSPDGRRLVIGFEDGAVRLWAPAEDDTWEESVFFNMPNDATDVRAVFTPDGDQLVTGDGSGHLRVWRVSPAGSELTHSIPTPGRIESLAVSPDGAIVIVGLGHGILQMWSLPRQPLKYAQLEGIGTQDLSHWYPRGAQGFALARSRRLLFTATPGNGDNPNVITAWRVHGRHLSQSFLLEGHTTPVFDFALSPDERFLVSVSGGRVEGGIDESEAQILLWDLEQKTHRILHDAGGLATLAFHPDGNFLVADLRTKPGVEPTPLLLFDLREDREPMPLTAPYPQAVWALEFTPDGKQLVVGHSDKGEALQIFDFDAEARELTPASSVTGNNDRLTQAKVSPDGTFLIAASTDLDFIGLWNLPDLTKRSPVPTTDFKQWAFCTAISPDSSLVAVGGGGSKVVVARSDGSGQVIARYQGKNQGIFQFPTQLEFDSDNRTLFMSFSDGQIVVWSIPPGATDVRADRYLEVVDISGSIRWKVRDRDLTPVSSSYRFANLEDFYLPSLQGASSPAAERLALFGHYIGSGQLHAAHSVVLAMGPDEAEESWPRLASAIGNTLIQARVNRESHLIQPTRHLGRSVFEKHPAPLEVEIDLLVESSDWDGLTRLLRQRLPELAPGERSRLLALNASILEGHIAAALERGQAISSDDPAIPPRDLLLAATIYQLGAGFAAAWEKNRWTASRNTQQIPSTQQVLDLLDEENQESLIAAGSTWKLLSHEQASRRMVGRIRTTLMEIGQTGESPIGFGKPAEGVEMGTELPRGMRTKSYRRVRPAPACLLLPPRVYHTRRLAGFPAPARGVPALRRRCRALPRRCGAAASQHARWGNHSRNHRCERR